MQPFKGSRARQTAEKAAGKPAGRPAGYCRQVCCATGNLQICLCIAITHTALGHVSTLTAADMLRALVVGCDWCQISWMGTLTWFGLAALTTPQPATSHSWVHWSVQVSYLIPGFTCTSVQCLVFVFVDMHHKCNTVLRHRSGVPEEWQFVLKSLVASTSGRHKWQAQVLGMNVCTEMYAASTASCRFTRPPCQLCPCRVWCSATNLSPSHQDAFTAIFYLDMSHREVASKLGGCKKSMVWSCSLCILKANKKSCCRKA